MTLRLLKFGVVGVINTALAFAVLNVALLVGLPTVAAWVVGWIVSFANSYWMNSRWTYADRRGLPVGETVAKFAVSNLIALGASTAAVWAAEGVLAALPVLAGVSTRVVANLAALAGVVVSLAVNFTLATLWAFREAHPLPSVEPVAETPAAERIAELYRMPPGRLAEALALDSAAVVRTPAAKRIYDVLLSLTVLILTSPLWLLVLAAELLDAALVPADRGWPVYAEVRVSQGRAFQLRKFRILRAAAIRQIREEGAMPKIVENTPGNLTAVGRLLKKTGLDELPQFVNILFGDMSFVGPRPKPLAEYAVEARLGLHRREVALAGLTGSAQLLKGSERTAGDDLIADLRYVDHVRRSSGAAVLAEDLRHTGRTVLLMLRMTGE